MVLKIDDLKDAENFVIENNILKGSEDEYTLETSNIGQVILDTLNSRPHHVAQIEADTKKQTTFYEMKDCSVRCGIWMKGEGIRYGDIVTICSPNHLDVYIPMLATFYIGATVISWNPEITLHVAQSLIKLYKPKIIFSCGNAVNILLEASNLENVSTRIIVIGKHTTLQSLQDIMLLTSSEEVQTFIPQEIENPHEAVAAIFLSSGSTGFPKGVMHSYKTTFKLIMWSSFYIAKDVIMFYSSPYWISGFFLILQSIFSYATKILHAKFDIDDTCRVIEKYKVQRLYISPLHITYLCKSNVLQKYDLNSLEYVFTGGVKSNLKYLTEFKTSLPNVAVIVIYGLTETGRAVTAMTKKNKNLNSVGFVLPGNTIKIMDLECSKALGPNEPGEIYVKLSTMMLGYYKNLEMTKETIDEDGWLHTGDKGYYNEDGEVFIIDRLKEVMKYRYHQVSPTEIEEILLSHPDVIEAAVVPIPHELDGERPIAYVRKVPTSTVTEEELVELTSSLGKEKKLWGGVKFLDALPRTGSGKVSKPHLIQMAKELVR